MRHAREQTELRHYFAIKNDLAAAVRDAAPEEIDFHIDELAVMARHTTSLPLARACNETIAKYMPAAAIRA